MSRVATLTLLLACATRVLALPGSYTEAQELLPDLLLHAEACSLELQRLLPAERALARRLPLEGLPAWQEARAEDLAGWLDTDSLQAGAWLRARASSREDRDPFMGFAGSLDWRPAPSLHLHLLFSTFVNEEQPRQFKGNWGEIHAGSPEAWLEYNRSFFSLRLGRMSLNTGAEAGRSLLLSGSNSLDGYRMELRPFGNAGSGGLWFSSFHLALDDRLEGARRYARWLAGHRLGYTKPGLWSLALGEAILYGRENGGPSAAAMNPFVSYHAVQLNGLEANTVFHLSGWARLPGRTLLTAELLLDDLQIDNEDAEDQEPAEWALQLDLRSVLPLKAQLDLGYTRIAQRTYNSFFPHQVWLFRERPLAHPLGADVEQWRVTLAWNGSRHLRPSLGLVRREQGERGPQAPFDKPWLDPPFHEDFPTGVVLRETRLEASLEAAWRDSWWRLSLQLPEIRNADHVAGRTLDESYVELSVLAGLPALPLP